MVDSDEAAQEQMVKEYVIIEKSRFNFAFGLKNAGSFGGTFSLIEPEGISILVVPSIVSIISEVCN